MEALKIGIVVSDAMGCLVSPGLSKAPARYKELEKAFNLCAKSGYDGVELFVDKPENLDATKILALAQSHHLEITALGTGPMYARRGLSLSAEDSSTRSKTLSALRHCISLAESFGSLLTIGSIRGKSRGGDSRLKALKRVGEGLGILDEWASHQGVKILLEPINRYETDLINTADHALSMIKNLSLTSTGLLLDTFHMNIEERSISDSIRKCKRSLLHLHVADSNRWPPGYGHLDFQQIIQTLRAVNYEGYLSSESLAKPDRVTAVKMTATYLRGLIKKSLVQTE